MGVHFRGIEKGSKWERQKLAELWGYKSLQALARGVFTPAGQNYIVLFVTEDKQQGSTQYKDRLDGGVLHWEGEDQHGSDEQIANARNNGDEIHVFHRTRHHKTFEYLGQFRVKSFQRQDKKPSEFTFETG